MKNVLFLIQIITAVLLIGVILMQSRGTGFSRGSMGQSFTRRGLEKLVFRLTFTISAIFIIVSFLQVVV